MPLFRATGRGIEASVRLTPRADRDFLGGLSVQADGREFLQARVRAAPSEGAANAALIALIAKQLGVPKSTVTIIAGAGQRLKRIEIVGESADLAARFSAAVQAKD